MERPLSACGALGILRAIPTSGVLVAHVFAFGRDGVLLVAFTLLAGTACRLEHYEVGDSGPPFFASVDIISSPAAPGSTEPSLTVGAGRRVYLSWIEPTRDSSYAFKLAVREGDHWSAARTIVRDKNLFVNWADFPSVVALPDGRLAAHWLQRSGPGRYSYGVRVSQSSDGGVTWTPPVTPHRPRVETEHGFASIWPAAAGRLGVLWLDGRKYRPTGQPAPNEMMLITTTIGPDNSLGSEVGLDDRVCDCCQTAVTIAGGGPVAVYRDRTMDEIRDIYVVRQVDGRWSPPKAIHNDGWRIAACPVNGPAIAGDGDRVVVAWFTAAADTPRVNVAFSDDAGSTFSLPSRVDNGSPTGRVDVVLQADGSALVSWLERTPSAGAPGGEGAEVRVRRVRADGSLAQWATVARSTAARASGFPRMAATSRGEVFFAWTAPGNPSVVRVARAIVRRSPEGGGVTTRLCGLLLFATTACTDTADGRRFRAPAAIDVGRPAPAYRSVSAGGDSVSLESLRGNPVLLNVWATWCHPCRDEVPELQRLYERYRGRGLQLVGVSVDAPGHDDAIRAFARQYGMTYPVWRDPNETVSAAFLVVGVPATFLIDRDGVLRWKKTGPIGRSDTTLVAEIERTLAEELGIRN